MPVPPRRLKIESSRIPSPVCIAVSPSSFSRMAHCTFEAANANYHYVYLPNYVYTWHIIPSNQNIRNVTDFHNVSVITANYNG